MLDRFKDVIDSEVTTHDIVERWILVAARMPHGGDRRVERGWRALLALSTRHVGCVASCCCTKDFGFPSCFGSFLRIRVSS